MKVRLFSLALVTVLMATFTLSAAAAPKTQKGGAAGVVAAVLQLILTDTVDINDSTVQVGLVNVDDSLNNLRALNNVLNNSPILSHNNVDITVYDINVLSNILNQSDIDVLYNFLNQNDIDVNSVIGVGVLNGGDLVVFQK